MNKKTMVALAAFFVLGIGAAIALRSPEKGERTGPRKGPPGVAAMKADGIDELEVQTGKDKTTLKKDSGKWMIAAPVHYAADADSVKTATEKLADLRWGDVLSEQKSKAKEMEVDDENGAHVVAKQGGKVLADLYFGKAVSGYTLVRPAHSDSIWQVVGSLKLVFAKDTTAWRDKIITEIKHDDLDTVTVDAGARGKITIKRVPGAKDKGPQDKYEIAESSLKIDKVDDTVLQGIGTGIGALRAFGFADGMAPADAGLASPAYTVIAKAGSKSYTVLIGKKRGDDVFVKTPESPQIFTMKEYAIDRLMKAPIEFRDKTLADIKPDEVVGLDITYAAAPIALEKSGSDWKVKKGSLVVDSAKVGSVAQSFQNWKANSFAETADAKTTGLAKPTGKVVVHTKDKKTVTFVVGALSGDDYYLQVAGRPDVYKVKKYMVDRILKKADDLKKADTTASAKKS